VKHKQDCKAPECAGTIDDARRALAALLPALAFASTAQAQDATKAQPAAYKVVLENDKLRVLEFNSRPGMGICGEGMHSHPAHLTVVLSDNAKARVKHNGKAFEATNKLGDVFWSEAETHEVENISGRNVRALIVELKTGKA
jgi:beta-alanine degradation protein BauB